MAYAGGKGRDGIFQIIINQIPPHTIYLEGFLGGAAIMREKAPAEFNIGIDRSGAAIAAAREEFENSVSDRLTPGLAIRPALASLRILTPHSAMRPGIDLLVIDKRVFGPSPSFTFRRMDVVKFLTSYKVTGNEFIYLDPPYLIETRSGKSALYEHEFTDWQHVELLKLIRRMKCCVAISGYPSRLYADMLGDWRRVDYRNTTRGHSVRTECLWCNYDEPSVLHDYRYIGDDFRDRERIRKVQRNLLGKLRRLPTLERRALIVEALKQLGSLDDLNSTSSPRGSRR